MNIEISKDKTRLDVPYVQKFLSQVYWAKGRTVDEVQMTIDNSECYGVYLDGKQIGFARLVTDFAVFAYLMDVFIDEAYRGKGYSSLLMKAIMEDPALRQVKIWRLATTDAGFLYTKFGFTPLAHPEKLMEKIARN